MNEPQSFNDAIAAIEDARRVRDAVTVEREALAPTRALAQQYLEEFRATVARLRPFFDTAVEKHNRAFHVGVPSPDLRRTLTEALTTIQNGGNGFQGIIDTIDTLNGYAIYQRWHLSIPGRLRNYRACIGYLDELAERAKAQLEALERRVLTEARHVPRVGAKQFPGRAEVTEDHTFDPRSA